MTKLRVLDLFSGAGMFSLGLERTGWFSTVAFCEIEPYARAVLKKHWPRVVVVEDVRNLRGNPRGELYHRYEKSPARGGAYDLWERIPCEAIDVICAGFPCQDLSVAGKGAGIGGEQSGLWSEVARLVGEIRPRYVLLENVANLLSGGNGQWFGKVLGDLAALGYDAEWDCLPATIVGAPHNRDRVWIIAYPKRDEQPREEPRFWPLRRVGRFEQSVPWDEPWESALSRFRGMDDGNARSVDRTDLIRNSLVPQIPEMIGHAILEAEREAMMETAK